MSIAGKLITVAENVEKVYNAGYKKGKSEGGGSSLINYADGISFPNDDWVEGDTLELNMPNLAYMDAAFYFSFKKIKNLIITSNTPIKRVNDCFYMGDELTVLEKITFNCDFSQVTSFARWFRKQIKLKRIEGTPISFEKATTIGGIFSYCNRLESFRVKPNTISANINLDTNYNLDNDTVQSVIEGLVEMPEGSDKKVTFTSSVKSRMSQAQKDEIARRNWTLA